MFCLLCNSKDTHLAGVLASLQVSSTEHGLSDHAREGVVTVLIRQNRGRNDLWESSNFCCFVVLKVVFEEHSRFVAVSSRHHPVVVDQGATTEMIARVQRHLMGLRMRCALMPSNNFVILCGN